SFNTTTGTLEVRGVITHLENLTAFQEGWWWEYQDFFIQRTLYIGNVLYTLSQTKLMYHDLVDLSYIGEIALKIETT
ncbi:MAG: hypothetical protein ACFFD8_09265, partial [Candidatus Thorarchaeota archaeon]